MDAAGAMHNSAYLCECCHTLSAVAVPVGTACQYLVLRVGCFAGACLLSLVCTASSASTPPFVVGTGPPSRRTERLATTPFGATSEALRR